MLGSGQGSTIQFFYEKTCQFNDSFQIASVITNNTESPLISFCQKQGIPHHVLPYTQENFKEWDQELCKILTSYHPQLILLAGFLKKIGPQVLSVFEKKILNSHPSLLPEFSGLGMYGRRVHEAVIQEKKKTTGITIHLVDKNYDKGRILNQKPIEVRLEETAQELEERVKKIEKDFYFETVLKILSKEIKI